MGGCSGDFSFRSVSLQTQRLYKLLKFEDKNENGIIEKKEHFWQRDEKYVPEVDVNGDGTIIEAEAKYYLQKSYEFEDINKDSYRLTEEEEKVIFLMRLNEARKINNPKQKLAKIHSIMTDVTDVDYSVKLQAIQSLQLSRGELISFLAETIVYQPEPECRGHGPYTVQGIFDLSSKLFGLNNNEVSGIVDKAISLIVNQNLPDKDYDYSEKHKSYSKIARLQVFAQGTIRAKLDKNETNKILNEALKLANQLSDSDKLCEDSGGLDWKADFKERINSLIIK